MSRRSMPMIRMKSIIKGTGSYFIEGFRNPHGEASGAVSALGSYAIFMRYLRAIRDAGSVLRRQDSARVRPRLVFRGRDRRVAQRLLTVLQLRFDRSHRRRAKPRGFRRDGGAISRACSNSDGRLVRSHLSVCRRSGLSSRTCFPTAFCSELSVPIASPRCGRTSRCRATPISARGSQAIRPR